MKIWLLPFAVARKLPARWVLAITLSLAVTPQAWPASPVGLMTVSGPVRIAGSDFQPKAVSSWPVLAGDEIVTEQRSRAVLISPTAGRLEIRQDSRVTASEDTVVLHGGEVGAERFVVRTGEYTATPHPDAAGRSWFVVSSRGAVPVFAAHQGDLWVSQGEGSPMLVRAGTYAAPAMPPEPSPLNPAPAGPAPASPVPGNSAAATPPGQTAGPPAAAAPQQEPRRDYSAALPGAQAAATAATTGWTVGSLSHASSAALVSGVSAAATAGTVTGVALVEPKALPDRSPSYGK
jgi:hypothetical protein